VAAERLALTDSGYIRYTLKTPYRDGTTHVMFEPMDFIARLVALVPKPRVHLTRYHGVFAPANALRDRVVPGSGTVGKSSADKTKAERHHTMTWAKRLKRVFTIDIERCWHRGGTLEVIASIEEPEVIERILTHLDRDEAAADPAPPSRGPPQGRLPI
jgi:hypothetical protein